MATGLIAAGNGAASISYTPTSNAKIRIWLYLSGAASFSINGANVTTSAGTFAFDIFAAANTAITFGSAATIYYVISSIEES